MSEGLFRQESMDHISSPEEMHDYLRVTSPSLGCRRPSWPCWLVF